MANTNNPTGLRYAYSLDGRDPIIQTCLLPSGDGTATFVGDPVKLDGTASANGFYPTVVQAAAGNAIYGVIVGIDQVKDMGTSLNLYRLHRPASTAMYCHVITSPNAVFEVQASGSLGIADVGLNADLTMATAGSSVTGLSGAELDTSAKDGTATRQLKILHFAAKADNEIGTNAKAFVKINNHQLGSHTGTAGV